MSEPHATGVHIEQPPSRIDHTGTNREIYHRMREAERAGWREAVELVADWIEKRSPELAAQFIAEFFEKPDFIA